MGHFVEELFVRHGVGVNMSIVKNRSLAAGLQIFNKHKLSPPPLTTISLIQKPSITCTTSAYQPFLATMYSWTYLDMLFNGKANTEAYNFSSVLYNLA